MTTHLMLYCMSVPVKIKCIVLYLKFSNVVEKGNELLELSMRLQLICSCLF